MPKRSPTPSQTIGPFFSQGLGPGWPDLTEGAGEGERIAVEGRVLDGDGKPIPDAMLEIWQADAQGRYPEQGAGFRGFGRTLTDPGGEYRFTTIKPGRVPGPGGAPQAPHLNLTIFARGLLRQLTTRIYFADEPSNETDPVLAAVTDPAARRTLFAARQDGSSQTALYRFDVILQGEGETAFFDV
ncbi:MAG: protocatechuate 3,4-dioxygenase subunit alpha [Deltaproteobacteria bacterium]|nr:MAG: protocatechuate 3,4-dioxygenase subunit alpha [Deltaproteobacteria bacterium]TMB25945.1 MAG: protocatechuate 3,4-dioxygenase subunit alpha [Deltaproteobacteria bacterium]TMB33759.1 MAG: protocatechuate 3,4-dioxygenase subunit alpha [Deltaproteobacteria bacterium]